MRTWWIWCDYMSWRCLDADFGWLDCAKTANSLLQNLVKDSARNRQSQPWMDNVYHNLNVAQTFFIQLGPGFRRNCIGIQWNSVFEDLHSQWNYMISYIEPRTHEEKMPTFAATLVCVCVCGRVGETKCKTIRMNILAGDFEKKTKCHTSSACRILELWGAIGWWILCLHPSSLFWGWCFIHQAELSHWRPPFNGIWSHQTHLAHVLPHLTVLVSFLCPRQTAPLPYKATHWEGWIGLSFTPPKRFLVL